MDRKGKTQVKGKRPTNWLSHHLTSTRPRPGGQFYAVRLYNKPSAATREERGRKAAISTATTRLAANPLVVYVRKCTVCWLCQIEDAHLYLSTSVPAAIISQHLCPVPCRIQICNNRCYLHLQKERPRCAVPSSAA